MISFSKEDLKKLWKPKSDSSGEDNGQVTIIGGSSLFHGAPLLAIKAASRMVDMVFFSSPEPEMGEISKFKSELSSFIWVPWTEVEEYVRKSDAVLIGPGLMRFHKENGRAEVLRSIKEDGVFDDKGTETRSITKYLLQKYPDKKWVIDGGSLQVLDSLWIPNGSVLTPNKKELEILFKLQNNSVEKIEEVAKEFNCVICDKGPTSYVTDGQTTYEITGGNAGLTKGGTGDTLAGMTVGLLAKNSSLLSAAAAAFVVKKTAEALYEKVGYNFNADDVADEVFATLFKLAKESDSKQ
ncbi:hypothetical protein A2397_01760 [Candidatus Amesbacteria bacterium RIFOXYB1_FULL_44_23]|uniref:ADP-dependent (S)-NAD(P)H-hydrate dehydratase n=1 Tax=Candidatus Amesbacteria bacterium RIFOXYB1_FULL_44_23 TaxID=1797263 RepID=A0A1F4ZTQ1_9BACT|nr:MAG: hypothetical protein A2397_01760 [Candidatus Amesbacteria bacterium RIFOXYB1_FULL_44_23]